MEVWGNASITYTMRVMVNRACHVRSRWMLLAAIFASGLLLVSSCPCTPPIVVGQTLANFHVIEPGQAYRSAQPDAAGLENVISQLGIKTVVNLRGTNTGKPWYDAEAQVCEAMGITLANHAMSAKSLPSGELLADIIDTLQTAEHPILIHCAGGSDRSGAISAIYRILILGHDKHDALLELSPFYLHFRNYAPCMDTLAELYEPTPEWLAEYAETVDEITCTP